MIDNRARIPCLLLLALVTACGSRSTTSQARPDRNLLSAEEIRAAGYADALTTVQSLRPLWLNKRGVSSINLQESVKIYLDGSLLGGPDQLQAINTSTIGSIRYMDAIEATARWGLDHGLGAIVVSTRREGRT